MNGDHVPLLAGHPQAALLAAIGEHSAAAGYRTAVVGGFVRDLLLGILSRDIDIAVEGDAIACARSLAERLAGKVVKTSRFGTALLMVGDTRIDLAMARTETYPRPGALPEVCPGTLAGDLWRRDFTVNAMALEITTDNFGRLLDPAGGKADLCTRLIRILHAGSFRDDPTRMLRAIRLAHRLDFDLAAPTDELLREAVRDRCWLTVGSRRLGQEMRLLFIEHDLAGLCRRLDGYRLFRPLFGVEPDDAMFGALSRVDVAGEWLGSKGLTPDPAATAAMIIGGRAETWLAPDNCARGWSARLPALRRPLTAPAGTEEDIPPAVLAYLWIMCQNEEEQFHLQRMLASGRGGAPAPVLSIHDEEENEC